MAFILHGIVDQVAGESELPALVGTCHRICLRSKKNVQNETIINCFVSFVYKILCIYPFVMRLLVADRPNAIIDFGDAIGKAAIESAAPVLAAVEAQMLALIGPCVSPVVEVHIYIYIYIYIYLL